MPYSSAIRSTPMPSSRSSFERPALLGFHVGDENEILRASAPESFSAARGESASDTSVKSPDGTARRPAGTPPIATVTATGSFDGARARRKSFFGEKPGIGTHTTD